MTAVMAGQPTASQLSQSLQKSYTHPHFGWHRSITRASPYGAPRPKVGRMVTPRHVSESGLERLQDDRFGMLVHWGLYSLIGATDWVMFHERYSPDAHEKLATRFEAAAFHADALVRLPSPAGQRYLTIT